MGLCIRNLRIRINSSKTFPHEIGLFLGYPVEDVKGFIENKGENCVKCGAWKVYCNPEEKMHFFLQDETMHRSVYEILQQWDGNIENDSVKHIYVS